jgi:hypothetical protein
LASIPVKKDSPWSRESNRDCDERIPDIYVDTDIAALQARMAQPKQSTPVIHTSSGVQTKNGNTNGSARRRQSVTGRIEQRLEEVAESAARDPEEQKQSGLLALAICVGGIYASL